MLTNSSALLQLPDLAIPAHHDVLREDVTLWHLGEHPPGVPRLPEPDKHGVQEAKAETRVHGVGVLACPHLCLRRTAPLAEVKERHIGVRAAPGRSRAARAPAAAGPARRAPAAPC